MSPSGSQSPSSSPSPSPPRSPTPDPDGPPALLREMVTKKPEIIGSIEASWLSYIHYSSYDFVFAHSMLIFY